MRRNASGFTLIEIMVVIAIIAGLVTTVAVVIPLAQAKSRKLQCQRQLGDLGKVWLAANLENPSKAQKYSGVSCWLAMRKFKTVRVGDEKVFCCPGDPGVPIPETEDERKRYDDVDLANPGDDMCSYAARDFKTYPVTESGRKEEIGCDRQGHDGMHEHHADGLNIVYDAGDVQFVTRQELELPDGVTVKIGPDAENPRLRKMVYKVARKD